MHYVNPFKFGYSPVFQNLKFIGPKEVDETPVQELKKLAASTNLVFCREQGWVEHGLQLAVEAHDAYAHKFLQLEVRKSRAPRKEDVPNKLDGMEVLTMSHEHLLGGDGPIRVSNMYVLQVILKMAVAVSTSEKLNWEAGNHLRRLSRRLNGIGVPDFQFEISMGDPAIDIWGWDGESDFWGSFVRVNNRGSFSMRVRYDGNKEADGLLLMESLFGVSMWN